MTRTRQRVLGIFSVFLLLNPLMAGDKKKVIRKVILLDKFEKTDWTTSAYEGAEIGIKTGQGRRGKGLKITYDLKETSQWVQISKPFNIASLEEKALEFWVKGKGKFNVLEIKLVDADGSTFGIKKMGLTSASEWTKIVLREDEFSYWWGGDASLKNIKEIFFAISAGAGGAGVIHLDDLRMSNAVKARVAKEGIIEDGNSTEGWTVLQGEGSECSLITKVEGKGKILVVSYSIAENQWISARKRVNLGIQESQSITIKIKGEGSPNNIEFKVIDRDDSTFAKVYEGLAGNNRWEKIKVPVSELQYMWGGDNVLDKKHIQYIEVAVSGAGGRGKIKIDTISVENN